MIVDRCVCAGLTFAELLRIQREHSLSFRQLTDRTGACRGCTLCEAYVRITLETGRTEHPLMPPPPHPKP